MVSALEFEIEICFYVVLKDFQTSQPVLLHLWHLHDCLEKKENMICDESEKYEVFYKIVFPPLTSSLLIIFWCEKFIFFSNQIM